MGPSKIMRIHEHTAGPRPFYLFNLFVVCLPKILGNLQVKILREKSLHNYRRGSLILTKVLEEESVLQAPSKHQ